MILVSFCSLLENMKKQPVSLQNKSITAIEKGMELDENFWNNFIQLLNAPENLSQLLDVPVNKISTWHQKIQDAMKETENINKNQPVGKNKKLL